jgi:hypothetical protein
VFLSCVFSPDICAGAQSCWSRDWRVSRYSSPASYIGYALNISSTTDRASRDVAVVVGQRSPAVASRLRRRSGGSQPAACSAPASAWVTRAYVPAGYHDLMLAAIGERARRSRAARDRLASLR